MSRSPLTETATAPRTEPTSGPIRSASPTASQALTTADVDAEISRQLTRIGESGQLEHVGWSIDELAAHADALRPALREAATGLPRPTLERVPFVLVLPPDILLPSIATTTLRLGRKRGFVSADTSDIDEFRPIEGVTIPSGLYAVLDARRGEEHLGRTPEEALRDLAAEGRSPLTVSEGIALLTAHPDALEKNHCFQTPGSRIGDRRVPGLWISGRAPKLGFCWAGNHHTWLGVASCSRRIERDPG